MALNQKYAGNEFFPGHFTTRPYYYRRTFSVGRMFYLGPSLSTKGENIGNQGKPGKNSLPANFIPYSFRMVLRFTKK